jgi:hypothetical protein
VIYDILKNRHNNITTCYYLLLKNKLKNNVSSIADVSSTSQLFLEYLKSDKSKLSYYRNDINEAIKEYYGYFNSKFFSKKINNPIPFYDEENDKYYHGNLNINLNINLNLNETHNRKSESDLSNKSDKVLDKYLTTTGRVNDNGNNRNNDIKDKISSHRKKQWGNFKGTIKKRDSEDNGLNTGYSNIEDYDNESKLKRLICKNKNRPVESFNIHSISSSHYNSGNNGEQQIKKNNDYTIVEDSKNASYGDLKIISKEKFEALTESHDTIEPREGNTLNTIKSDRNRDPPSKRAEMILDVKTQLQSLTNHPTPSMSKSQSPRSQREKRDASLDLKKGIMKNYLQSNIRRSIKEQYEIYVKKSPLVINTDIKSKKNSKNESKYLHEKKNIDNDHGEYIISQDEYLETLNKKEIYQITHHTPRLGTQENIITSTEPVDKVGIKKGNNPKKKHFLNTSVIYDDKRQSKHVSFDDKSNRNNKDNRNHSSIKPSTSPQITNRTNNKQKIKLLDLKKKQEHYSQNVTLTNNSVLQTYANNTNNFYFNLKEYNKNKRNDINTSIVNSLKMNLLSHSRYGIYKFIIQLEIKKSQKIFLEICY